jgi:hypothetical protein
LEEFVKKVMACAGLIVLFALSFSWNGSADEFMAMPGFWKITTKTSPTDAPQIKWVCVGEAADPWVSFAHLRLIPQLACKRDGFERTSTTLKWRLDCTGPFTLSNTGALVFDTAKHFTGQVHLSGTIMDYPIDQSINVEGQRIAACTTPAD